MQQTNCICHTPNCIRTWVHARDKLTTPNLVRTSTDHQILRLASQFRRSALAIVSFRCHGSKEAARDDHRWARSLTINWHKSQRCFSDATHSKLWRSMRAWYHKQQGVTCLTVYDLNRTWRFRHQRVFFFNSTIKVAVGMLRGRTFFSENKQSFIT